MNKPILARDARYAEGNRLTSSRLQPEPSRVRLLGTVAVAAVLAFAAVLSLSDMAQAMPKDPDHDGVPNSIDACPTTAGDASNNGCPLPPEPTDRDNDGVPDSIDSCPDIAGDASNNGCPLPPEPTPTVPVTYVNPGADLDATVNSLSSPRIYKIAQGKYTVDRPLNLDTGDQLIGVYSAFPRPTITQTTTVQTIVDANGTTNVKISGLRIERAHGIKANQPATGRGVSGGNNLTLRDVRLTENANQGVGGVGPGLVIIDSEVDHNGAGASGAFYAQDGGETAAGIKSVNSMKVVNTCVHDNAWTGVWCDLSCDDFEVRDSTIVRNGRAGIHDEISTGPALFVNNRIQDNGHAPYVWGRYGGVLIVSSQNVEVYGNTFGNNLRFGVDIYEDSRDPRVNNVSVYTNQSNDDTLAGCGLPGVSCTNN